MINAATTSDDGDGLAVRLTGVSVRYRVPTERVTTLKERIIRLLQGRPPTYRDFWALEGIDLELRQGEALGIIGRNGAGKSTLLKVISRILRPTRGRVWVRGRVAPMIELGTGFHPELTGRENIFLNGAVLGFSHAEMQDKLERIIDFSELKDFIDAPLRTYSSGMMVRLGFAVASDVDPDILIIDEVLSVGDVGFQEKSRARMNSFRDRGVTILYVTHDLTTLSELCDRSLLLDRGRIADAGEVSGVVESYRRLIADSQGRGTSANGGPSMGQARAHS